MSSRERKQAIGGISEGGTKRGSEAVRAMEEILVRALYLFVPTEVQF